MMHGRHGGRSSYPLDILKERFARGEITQADMRNVGEFSRRNILPRRRTAMTYTAEKAPQVSRKITLPSYAMIALTLIGIADAAYVARGNYTGALLWCPILDGCNTVISSPYSRVFGVPMSYFGFIYYLFMFGLAARLA